MESNREAEGGSDGMPMAYAWMDGWMENEARMRLIAVRPSSVLQPRLQGCRGHGCCFLTFRMHLRVSNLIVCSY